MWITGCSVNDKFSLLLIICIFFFYTHINTLRETPLRVNKSPPEWSCVVLGELLIRHE